MGHSAHWDDVYVTRSLDEVSWYQSTPRRSLEFLQRFAAKDRGVIDVGCGAGSLVGELLDHGYLDVSALDISAAALAHLQNSLGERSHEVEFICADVATWTAPRTYFAWHDRAVLHFLTDEKDREQYVRCVSAALDVGGVALIATFAGDGPTSCSGLPVVRYDAVELAELFGEQFDMITHDREEHVTPSGAIQPFTWVVLRRN